MDKDIRRIIANNICGLRKQNKMTQAELAEKLYYSDKAVSKWERGDALPDAECLYKIALIFGVDIQYLFTEHDYTENKTDIKELEKREVTLKLLFIFSIFFICAILLFNIISSFLDKAHSHKYAMLMFFITMIPAALLIFNNIMGRKKFNLMLISLIIWTLTEAFYLLFYDSQLDGLFAVAMLINAGFIFWPRLSGGISLKSILKKINKKDN